MESPTTIGWMEWSGRTLDEQQQLCACIDACLSCELLCAIAADVAEALADVARGRQTIEVVLGCAAICHSTAKAIADLPQPDVGAVVDELESCRAACGHARRECERRPFDPCSRMCAEQCARCELECDACLRLVTIDA
jgi:hypothetical protein